MPFDLTVSTGQQTDKLQIRTILLNLWDDATGPSAVITYREFETDGTTFVRDRQVTISDQAALKTLLDVSGTFPVYTELESILHTQLIAEGVHGAGVDI